MIDFHRPGHIIICFTYSKEKPAASPLKDVFMVMYVFIINVC